MAEISGVILNWKRPANVHRILAGWRAGGLVSEAIVWNNNRDLRFEHDWARVINANEDFGLYTRFAAACLARHECILIQDDDLEAPTDTLRALHEMWQGASDRVHGIFGRRPRSNGTYYAHNVQRGPAPVVLTRLLVARRSYAFSFFAIANEFSEIQDASVPKGNGEDIIFSFVAMRESGNLNAVHPLPITELPAPHSIHGRGWSRHVSHRSRLLKACEEWLKGERHEDRGDLLHV